jgi:hypothetical protein
MTRDVLTTFREVNLHQYDSPQAAELSQWRFVEDDSGAKLSQSLTHANSQPKT